MSHSHYRIHPFDEDVASKPISYLSQALFGNRQLLPAAQIILNYQQAPFQSRHLGDRGDPRRASLNRLERLGFIEQVTSSGARTYRQVDAGSTITQIFQTVVASIQDDLKGISWTPHPVDPPLRDRPAPAAHWWTREIDKMGAYLLSGSSPRFAMLTTCYEWPANQSLWIATTPQTGQSTRNQYELGQTGMLCATGEPIRDWQCWERPPTPLWQVVPLMWQWMRALYPHPNAVYTFSKPSIYTHALRHRPADLNARLIG